MSRQKDTLFLEVITVIIIAVFGIAMALSVGGTKAEGSSSTSTYVLTLVITTQNTFNSSVGQQPAYYILGSNGLESSANITVPSDQPIELVIVCYDDGSATLLDPQYANVSGIPGGIYVTSNTNVNSTQGPNGILVNETSYLTQVPADLIAHTFTVAGLLSIPVEVNSTTVAYFTATAPGTYQWSCMTECGSGPDGTEGAMATPGWMTGSFVVLPVVTPSGPTTPSTSNTGLVTVAILGTLLIGFIIGFMFRRTPNNHEKLIQTFK